MKRMAAVALLLVLSFALFLHVQAVGITEEEMLSFTEEMMRFHNEGVARMRVDDSIISISNGTLESGYGGIVPVMNGVSGNTVYSVNYVEFGSSNAARAKVYYYAYDDRGFPLNIFVTASVCTDLEGEDHTLASVSGSGYMYLPYKAYSNINSVSAGSSWGYNG